MPNQIKAESGRVASPRLRDRSRLALIGVADSGRVPRIPARVATPRAGGRTGSISISPTAAGSVFTTLLSGAARKGAGSPASLPAAAISNAKRRDARNLARLQSVGRAASDFGGWLKTAGIVGRERGTRIYEAEEVRERLSRLQRRLSAARAAARGVEVETLRLIVHGIASTLVDEPYSRCELGVDLAACLSSVGISLAARKPAEPRASTPLKPGAGSHLDRAGCATSPAPGISRARVRGDVPRHHDVSIEAEFEQIRTHKIGFSRRGRPE